MNGDEVDGRAHQCNAHYPTLVEQVGDALWFEVFQAHPQSEVSRVRRLYLQADKSLDHLQYPQVREAQQQYRRSVARLSARRPSTSSDLPL